MEGKTTELMVQIKRIYEPAEKKDGYRMLIDRLWPRGLKKEAANIDLWLKDIAPTPALRTWFHEAPIERWPEFKSRYRNELLKNEALTELTELIEKHKKVTILYGAKDDEHNHALILQDFLKGEHQQKHS